MTEDMTTNSYIIVKQPTNKEIGKSLIDRFFATLPLEKTLKE